MINLKSIDNLRLEKEQRSEVAWMIQEDIY